MFLFKCSKNLVFFLNILVQRALWHIPKSPWALSPLYLEAQKGRQSLSQNTYKQSKKDIKTGQTKIKHNKKGQKCRSNNKHEKLCCRSHPLITALPSHRATSHVGAFPTHSPPTPPAPEEEVQHHFGRGVKIKPCQERVKN